MPKAFIAMPFDQKFYHIYKVIQEACQSLSVQTIRIDEVWAREDIYKQIEEEILNAEFMIADFTGDRMMEVANPNVVHEAAFARTKKKYLILMAQDHKCLPFDWRTRPAIIYQNNEEGLKYLKDRLVMSIQALMQKEDFGRDASVLNQAPAHMHNIPAYPSMPSQQQVAYSASNPHAVPANSPLGEIMALLSSKVNTPITGQTPALSQGFSKKGEEIICEVDGSPMIWISSAEFSMGSEEDEDQRPIHKITLSDFLFDKYPVTNERYRKFMEAGGYSYQGFWSQQGWAWRCTYKIEKPAFWDEKALNQPQQPVVGVSWYEATAYATWVGKHLPTEAQWELAARGKEGQPYPWGKQKPTKTRANFKGKAPVDITELEKGASPYGCYHLSGNVWEWCYDWYSEQYYHTSPPINPIGPLEGDEKACRGGSWTYDKDTLKAYYRFFGEQNLRDKGFGFRCARIL